jgi:hypothetical protein
MCDACGREMTEACLNAWAAMTITRLTHVERSIEDRALWWRHEENDRHE